MEAAVVISSCDHFRDAWAPFFHFFFKYWPDCPYPVYLLSNHGTYRDERVTCLALGRDRHWAANMLLALDQIPSRKIIYFQEDFFLTRRVLTEELLGDMRFMETQGAASLCLIPPPPDSGWLTDFDGRANIAQVAGTARLRVCLQASVWEVQAFRSLLRVGETGWDLEKHGSERSRGMLLLRVRSREESSLDYLSTAIVRGAWEPTAVEMCRQDGVMLDLKFRAMRPETKGQRLRRRMRSCWEQLRQFVFPQRFEVLPVQFTKN